MSDTAPKPEDMDLVLYIYETGADKKRENAIAIFVYKDKQTLIYPKPDSLLTSGLNRYAEKVRSGLTKNNPWQQFNYLIRGAYQPSHETFELNDEEQSKVSSILQSWDELE